MTKRDLTDKEYILHLEAKIARLGRLLDISETQKEHLKKKNHNLQEKIAEIIKNTS